MGWFNPYGMIFMAVFMVPNIVFTIKRHDGFENAWDNKPMSRSLLLIAASLIFAPCHITISYRNTDLSEHER